MLLLIMKMISINEEKVRKCFVSSQKISFKWKINHNSVLTAIKESLFTYLLTYYFLHKKGYSKLQRKDLFLRLTCFMIFHVSNYVFLYLLKSQVLSVVAGVISIPHRFQHPL